MSTTLTLEEQRRFKVVADEWVETNPASRWLKLKLIELIEDWGGFLDVNLYRAGLVHFLGGANSVCKPVEILRGEKDFSDDLSAMILLCRSVAIQT